MTDQVKDETKLKLYLLGETSTEERLELEERFFLEPSFYEKLRAVEDDLIDDYIDGELSADVREKLESVLLSNPSRHQDIRIAKAIKRYAETHPVPAGRRPGAPLLSTLLSFIRGLSTFWKVSLATAAVASVAMIGLVVIRLMAPSTQTGPNRDTVASNEPLPGDAHNANRGADVSPSPDEEGRSNQNRGPERVGSKGTGGAGDVRSPRPAPTPGTDAAPATVYSFLLLPGGQVREGGETNKVSLPQDADSAQLQLPLVGETDYPNYRAVLRGEDNRTVRVRNGLKSTVAAEGKIIHLTVPARSLSAQQYRLRLDGLSRTGQTQEYWVYTFRVERR